MMRRTDSLEKTLMLGKIEGRRRGWQDKMVDGITALMDMSLSKLLGAGDGQESLVCCSPLGRKDMTEWLNWTESEKFSDTDTFAKCSMASTFMKFQNISIVLMPK